MRTNAWTSTTTENDPRATRALFAVACCLILAGCGGGGDDDGNGGGSSGGNPPPPGGNDAPGIQSFGITGALEVGGTTTFEWEIADVNGDDLVCTLDVNGDKVAEYTIDPCPLNGSQDHVYTDGGEHEYRFEVDDGNGGVKLRKEIVRIDGPIFAEIDANHYNYAHPEEYYVPDPFRTYVRVNSDVQITEAHATVDGVEFPLARDDDCGTCRVSFEGFAPLDGIESGTEIVLAIAVTDASGRTSTIYRTRSVDRAPELTILEGPNGSVGRPTLDVEAECTDDLDDCVLELCDDSSCNNVLASGTGHVAETLDLSRFGHSLEVFWRAEGSHPGSHENTTDSAELIWYVETSTLLEEADAAPGPILDFDIDRILYADDRSGAEELWLLDRSTREALELTSGLPDASVVAGRLTPTGAMFNISSTTVLYEWWNGQLIELDDWAEIVVIAGDYGLWRESDSHNTYLRQFSMNTQTLICQCSTADVTSDGVVAFLGDDLITVYEAGVFTPLALGAAVARDDIATNGSLFVYRGKIESDDPFRVMLYDGLTEIQLSSVDTTDYRINDDWIAFQKPGPFGNLQIYLRDAQGVNYQLTDLVDVKEIEALGPDGTVAFVNNPADEFDQIHPRYLADATGNLTEVGDGHIGEPKNVDGVWYLMLGRELFRIVVP
jgi:hypothetical protein